jgi:hypothetical protein
MRRLAMVWRALTALVDVILNPRLHRRRAALLLFLMPALAGCATSTKPLTIACTSCALLQSSGLCVPQAAADRGMLAAPKEACPEGQRQEIVNYRQWLDGIEAPKVECRNYR